MRVDEGVKMPRRATKGSIGYDFYAPKDITIRPGEYSVFGTGVYFTDEDTVNDRREWAMLLFPRSGLGFRYGTSFRNTVGVIDCDYRNEIGVSMTADKVVTIKKGEAYMQGIIIPRFTFDNEIEPTEERVGGFGSTDKPEDESEEPKLMVGVILELETPTIYVEYDDKEHVVSNRAIREFVKLVTDYPTSVVKSTRYHK